MPVDYANRGPRTPNKKPTKAQREKSAVIEQKHKVFADAILEGQSEASAARVAGYHPSTARNVMRQEEVQEYIAEGRREVGDISTIKRLDILNIFIEAIDMARTLADPAQMINGAKEAGKMLGYYEPETIKLEVTGSHQALAAKFKALTDSELLEIAAGRAKVVEGEVVND